MYLSGDNIGSSGGGAGASTTVSPAGGNGNVLTRTASETIGTSGTTVQVPVYTPAPPSYDYLSGTGSNTLVTAPGTAPPYYNTSGNVNPLYAPSPAATAPGSTSTAAASSTGLSPASTATAASALGSYWPILAAGVLAALVWHYSGA
jgi:hypothetical protein